MSLGGGAGFDGRCTRSVVVVVVVVLFVLEDCKCVAVSADYYSYHCAADV